MGGVLLCISCSDSGMEFVLLSGALDHPIQMLNLISRRNPQVVKRNWICDQEICTQKPEMISF